MEPDIKVPFLKKEAKVDITLGTEFLHKMDALYGYLINGRQSEVANIKTKIEQKEPLNEWDVAVMTVSSFLSIVYKKAMETEQVEYRSLESTLQQVVK